ARAAQTVGHLGTAARADGGGGSAARTVSGARRRAASGCERPVNRRGGDVLPVLALRRHSAAGRWVAERVRPADVLRRDEAPQAGGDRGSARRAAAARLAALSVD